MHIFAFARGEAQGPETIVVCADVQAPSGEASDCAKPLAARRVFGGGHRAALRRPTCLGTAQPVQDARFVSLSSSSPMPSEAAPPASRTCAGRPRGASRAVVRVVCIPRHHRDAARVRVAGESWHEWRSSRRSPRARAH